MGMLRRVSEATALVAVAISGSAAALWVLGRAGAVDVLVIFTLSLLTVYAAMVTAAGIVLVTNEAAEGEKDGGGPSTNVAVPPLGPGPTVKPSPSKHPP